MQTLLDGLGTPAIGSTEIAHASQAIDAALAVFLGRFLAANGVDGADPAAVLDDLLRARDGQDAAAEARLPACVAASLMFADALVIAHRNARYLVRDAAFVDGFDDAR